MPSQFTRNITTSFSSRMLDLVSDLITGLFKRRQTRIYLSVAPVLCTDTHGDSTRLTPAAFEPRTRSLQEEAVPKQGFSEANGIRINGETRDADGRSYSTASATAAPSIRTRNTARRASGDSSNSKPRQTPARGHRPRHQQQEKKTQSGSLARTSGDDPLAPRGWK